jgi:hypothetical protein
MLPRQTPAWQLHQTMPLMQNLAKTVHSRKHASIAEDAFTWLSFRERIVQTITLPWLLWYYFFMHR